MNQPLFLNTNIINPHTFQSWTRNSFPNISLSTLYRVADLFTDFDIDRYVIDPEIISLQHPALFAHMLNTKFSKPRKDLMITLQTWLDLIDSIPEEWIELILQGTCNQRPPIPFDFYILPNYDSPHFLTQGDIYQYLPDEKTVLLIP